MSRVLVFGLASLVVAGVLLADPIEASEQTQPELGGQTLVVATKPAPPFVIRGDDGAWTGLSIELWKRVAADLGVEYEIREAGIPEMLEGLEDGTFDVSAAAMTVTPEREIRVDFIHPFHTTGLAIAVRDDYRHGWLGSLLAFFSADFLRVVLALIVLLLVCGLLVWLFERRKNPEMFGGTTPEGVGSGFWWAAVTMTTVGYGDKAPRTIGGRIVALVWMFASLIVISGFTASIASALTLGGLGSPVQGPEDLDEVRVGTVPQTTSALYLDEQNIPFEQVESVPAGLDALHEERIDALVYDRPILLYLVRTEHSGRLQVLPPTFERQDYAFAVRPDSTLREPINRTVLELVAGERAPEWKKLLKQYLE